MDFLSIVICSHSLNVVVEWLEVLDYYLYGWPDKDVESVYISDLTVN